MGPIALAPEKLDFFVLLANYSSLSTEKLDFFVLLANLASLTPEKLDFFVLLHRSIGSVKKFV